MHVSIQRSVTTAWRRQVSCAIAAEGNTGEIAEQPCVLVTGASSGIGQATALLLANRVRWTQALSLYVDPHAHAQTSSGRLVEI